MSISDLFSGLTGAVTQGINTAVGGPFDFTGSLMNAGQTFDPSQFNPATYGSTYGNLYGGTDQYGQTAAEVQSSDPGNQLQGTQQTATQQNQNQQPQPQAPQNAQPALGSLLAAVNARGYQGNPYVIGGGGAVPNVPLTPNQAVQQRFGTFAPPAAQPAPPAPAVPSQPPAPQISDGGAIDAQAGPPTAPRRAPLAARVTDAGGEPLHGGGEVTEAPPAGQQAGQMPPQLQQIVGNFLRSPIGQLINQLTGGQLTQMLQQPQGLAALQQQYGNQIPRGYTAQNMPPWMTPQQYQQYLQTGQMPSRTPAGGPGGQQGEPGAVGSTGYLVPTRDASNVFQAGAAPVRNMIGAPPGTLATTAGQGELTGTVDQSQIPKPSPDVQRAIAQADTTPYPTNSIQGRQANIMATGGPGYTDVQGNRRQGMSPNAIAGVFMNVRDESGFNPNLRHPDQPRYGGEARYAHGLYQEGGPDWPLFQQFLNGRDWRDPTLQTQFMMQHFAQRNPRAWNAMNNAPTSGQAAVIFLNNYLIPRPDLRQARAARYARSNQQVAMQ